MNKIPITIVVPVKDEETNLPRCLSRLGRFNEVIVVDSNSSDRTPQIAREFGATYVNFEWNGQFPKKRNWVLLNYKLQSEWVLFLDADEFVDDAFCAAVGSALIDSQHSGYWLNYTNYFLGKQLRHGLPQRKLALFKVGSALYERIDEESWSGLDMEIHEHPIVDGSVGEIVERIDHNDDRGISKFIDRHKEYAAWEARRVEKLNDGGPDVWLKLTPRQTFKYKNITKWWYPWFYFVGQYFGKLGFLDGAAGFYYAFYKSWYFLTIRLLFRQNRQQARAPG